MRPVSIELTLLLFLLIQNFLGIKDAQLPHMWTKIIPSTEANASRILPKMSSKWPKSSIKTNNCI